MSRTHVYVYQYDYVDVHAPFCRHTYICVYVSIWFRCECDIVVFIKAVPEIGQVSLPDEPSTCMYHDKCAYVFGRRLKLRLCARVAAARVLVGSTVAVWL